MIFVAQVYVWLPDGTVERVSPEGGMYFQSCVHPDGNLVVFAGSHSGPPRLWLADLTAKSLTPLTPPDECALHPSFSWDGDYVVFASDRATDRRFSAENLSPSGALEEDSPLNLFIMRSDGSEARQLTFGAAQDQRPVFNPAGDTVAFVSNRDGSYRLWTIGLAAGAEPRPLLTEGWQLRPWYGQDGQHIYFFTEVAGHQRICRVSATGGSVETLPNDAEGDSRSPFITPDGRFLLMHSNRDGQWGMWELPLDGSQPRRLDPPGFSRGSHLTRARNGVMAFDYVSLARPSAPPAEN